MLHNIGTHVLFLCSQILLAVVACAVHKTTATNMLNVMIEVDPNPRFAQNPHVAVFGADQNNLWQASKNSRQGHFRGAERLTAAGMPTVVRSTTVLNCVQRHVPFTLGMLTPVEVAEITEKGPYTEDYRNILPVLQPAAVKVELWTGLGELIELTERCVENLPNASVEQLSRAMLERKPQALGGPSPFYILPSIQDCDTKSFNDVFKFMPVLWAQCLATCIVMIGIFDGQGVEILRATKRRHPDEYKPVLIGNGPFHAYCHFIFAIHQGFWKCFLCQCAVRCRKPPALTHVTRACPPNIADSSSQKKANL